MVNEEAEKYKDKGNAAFKDKDFAEAIKQYNKAITLDPDNAVYYSNRAGAWHSQGKYDSALNDAKKAIDADPKFVKGYSRKGAALLSKGEKDEAEKAYKEGLQKEPGNAACTSGLEEVKKARAYKPPPQPRASSSGGGFGGGGGLLDTIMAKLRQGGKMQMYMLAMGGYFLFSNFMKQGRSSSSSSSSPPVAETEDDVMASSDVSRTFKHLEGQWLSYMQGGAKSDSMFLMLHRTASSADVEFSSVFSGLASVNARLVAPDRPCHGFSPCPSSGEPRDSKWLSSLMRAEGQPEKLAILAVGRDAIAQALALAQKKKEVQLVMMMKPKVLAPSRSSTTDADEDSAAKTAATAIWRAAGSEQHQAVEPKAKKPSQSCHITLLYEPGDEEDEALVTSLDNQGVEVKTRNVSEDETLADILADEVRRGLDDVADDTL